jgi:hypothetical protein
MSLTKIKTKYKQLKNLSFKIEKISEQLLSLLLEYYDGEQDIKISEGLMITFGLDAYVCPKGSSRFLKLTRPTTPLDYIIKVITENHKFTDEDLEIGSI